MSVEATKTMSGSAGSGGGKGQRSSMKLPTRFIPKRILERLEGEGSTSPRDAMLSPKRKASTLTQISEWMDAERSKQAHDSIHDVLEGKVADLLRTPDDQLEMLLEWICPDLDPDDPPPSLADFPLSGPINDSRGVSNEIQSRVIFTERNVVCTLLSSRDEVSRIVEDLGHIEEQIEQVDTWLNLYTRQLKSMKRYFDQIETENATLEISSYNRQSILNTIKSITTILEPTREEIEGIEQDVKDFRTDAGREKAIKAADFLRRSLTHEFDREILSLQSVREQRLKIHKMRDKFGQNLIKYFQELFAIRITRGAILDDSGKVQTLKLSDLCHTMTHKKLMQSQHLLLWIKDMHKPTSIVAIRELYYSAMCEQYKRDAILFFSHLRFFLKKEYHNTSFMELLPSRDLQVSSSYKDLNTIEAKTKGSKEGDLMQGKKLERTESRTEPIHLKASRFVLYPKLEDGQKLTIEKLIVFATYAVIRSVEREKKFATKFLQISEKEVQAFLKYAFEETIEQQLHQLINEAFEIDPFYLIAVLVQTHDSCMLYSDQPDSVLVSILSDLQRQSMLLFNQYIESALQIIKDLPISKKVHGTLGYMQQLPILIDRVERFITLEEARSLIDPSYHKLILSVFSLLNRLREQSNIKEKYRIATVLENYWYFARALKTKQVRSIAEYVAIATTRYNEELDRFVEYLIVRHFESLVTYFRDMEELLRKIPLEEVPFQNSHSPEMFGKLIAKYPAANFGKKIQLIERTITALFKDEDLMHVIWETFKRMMMVRFQLWEERTEKCYTKTLPIKKSALSALLHGSQAE